MYGNTTPMIRSGTTVHLITIVDSIEEIIHAFYAWSLTVAESLETRFEGERI